jgi:hypothetical protein
MHLRYGSSEKKMLTSFSLFHREFRADHEYVPSGFLETFFRWEKLKNFEVL